MTNSNIEAAIRDLEVQKAKIDAAISSLRGLNGYARQGSQGRTTKTIIGVTLAHLQRIGQTQTNAQIREAIRMAGIKATNGSIQTILTRRGRLKRDLVRKGRGVWGLKTH